MQVAKKVGDNYMKKIIFVLLTIAVILSASLPALAAGINSTPVIILKCDDLKSNDMNAINNFESLFKLLQEEGVTASFGVVGNSVQGNQEIFWKNVNNYISNGIEIWHHGWLHRKNAEGVQEYNGMLNYDEMKENFKKTLDLVEKNADGYKILTFGAPYNAVNDEFMQMLKKEYPQIKTVFYTSKGNDSVVKLTSKMSIESGTGVASFSVFEKSYDPELEYAAIQSHPGGFDDHSREEYRKMIHFLKEKKSIFMTPSQYTNYVNDMKAYRNSPEEKISVLCYNKLLDFDVYPYLENDRTFIPIRAVSENLDAFVTWNEETQTVKIYADDYTLKLVVGSDIAYKDGEEVRLDAPVRVVDGRTMVPLRFIAEAFGAEVQWDNALNMAIIK